MGLLGVCVLVRKVDVGALCVIRVKEWIARLCQSRLMNALCRC